MKLSMNRISEFDTFPDFLYRMEDFLSLIGHTQIFCTRADLILLYSIVINRMPASILEIGRAYGGSTIALLGATIDSNKGKLFSVDIKNSLNGDVEKLLLEHGVTIIVDDSKNLLTNLSINSRSYEMFFIDGDHHFDMVKSDIELCYKLSSDNAIFMLHDIIKYPDVKDAIIDCCSHIKDLHYCGSLGNMGILIRK